MATTSTAPESDAAEPSRDSAPHPPGPSASLSGKLGVRLLLLALGLGFAMVTWIVMSAPIDRNELGLIGDLEISVESDTVVYVGQRKKPRSGTVTLSWNDLLGVSGKQAVAVTGVAPEKLAAEGAEIVWSKPGQQDVHRGEQDVNFRFDEYLFRQIDGTQDHVLAITCEFPEATGQWKTLMIPIRARSSDDSVGDYFPQFENERAGSFSRGMIPSRHDHAKFVLKLDVRRGTWPTEVEMPNAKLWRPHE
ncbi:hypothetical protein [Aeoliella mucimassa]|uniref:Uncharacterized protein n=1 Tax=Aeoliella mucimassa TaxID=2527972 RepID=A0A518ATR1_9BACT|nr:hypothetical protein [Aeoliella mucimassa]QDU58112.1 hypothetical protein Pan181_43380 [Aeoliella mucimassa]